MQREENWEVPLNVLPTCKCCMLGWTCDKGTNRQTDEQTLGLPFHFIRRWMCYGDRVCGQVRLNIWVWDFEYDVYSCSISLFTLLLIDSDLERLKNAVDTFLETEIVTNQQILTTGDFFPWKKRISNFFKLREEICKFKRMIKLLLKTRLFTESFSNNECKKGIYLWVKIPLRDYP